MKLHQQHRNLKRSGKRGRIIRSFLALIILIIYTIIFICFHETIARRSLEFLRLEQQHHDDLRLSQEHLEHFSTDISKQSSRRQFACNSNDINSEYYVNDKFAHRHIYRGRVLQEFLQRTLHHSISQSNVLIVGPDIKLSRSMKNRNDVIYTNKNETTIVIKRNDACGPSQMPLNYASNEGHEVHLVQSNNSLNDWWDNIQSIHANPPKWFLLTYLVGGEDEVGSIDSMLELSQSSRLFQESTMTYLVFEVYAEKYVRAESSYYRIVGLSAVETLLHFRYKIQLLASSHFFCRYHPNHLFKRVEDVRKFLQEGADYAASIDDDHLEGVERVKVLLFATQVRMDQTDFESISCIYYRLTITSYSSC